MKDDDFAVLEFMERMGGGFVQALAKAAFKADAGNYARLKTAFPEIWVDYKTKLELVQKRKET